LFYRGNPTQPVPYAFAVFYRTAGAELRGSEWQGYYSAQADSTGGFPLLGNAVFSAGLLDVVGDVRVIFQVSPLRGESVVHGVHLRPTYLYRPPAATHFLGVGPNLTYFTRLYNRATAAGVAGVPVAFTRTGGIRAASDTFTAVSDAGGNFVYRFNPLEQGTLIGDLTVRPPGSAPLVVRGVRLDTFDADGIRFLSSIGIGPHLPYLGIVHAQGKGIAGVAVEARRVGGIETDPAVVFSTSDANGIFSLTSFAPRSTGTLLVDLIFRPPPPYTSFIIKGVSLVAIDKDSDGLFVGIWDVDRSNPPFPERSSPANGGMW
jgi:hypothetical protein